MKFVALVSGGKDSIFAIMECQQQGHELVACVHLGRPLLPQKKRQSSSSNDNEDNEEEEVVVEESYMYQTAGSEVVQVIVEQCLQVPFILHVRQGTSVNTSLVYQQQQQQLNDNKEESNNNNNNNTMDEVEDLYQALHRAKQEFPNIQAVCSGAILSTYQRVRIENVCQRLKLISLSFLWRRASQMNVLQEMIHTAHIHAILVRTAAPPGLIPHLHLNQSIATLQNYFYTLHKKFQFHVCGEGGEYETLCLDCPIYKKRLVLDQVKIHESANNDGVGVLEILACHAEEKNDNNDNVSNDEYYSNKTAADDSSANVQQEQYTSIMSSCSSSPTPPPSANVLLRLPRLCFYPHIRRMRGGLWHISDICSPTIYHHSIPPTTTTSLDENKKEQQQQESAASAEAETALAVQEALQVFEILQTLLHQFHCTPQDVVYVHLYLSQMSHFSSINPHFEKVFGVLLPPSRSCVAIPTSSSRRLVQLDCMVLCGSGEYMRRRAASCSSVSLNMAETTINPYTAAALTTTSTVYRNVLHVQSRSHWAPVCVGPYSQANTLYSALHVLAGQIGLQPASMTLRLTWEEQLQQIWRNIASVLDALDSDGSSSLSNNLLSGLVYIADKIYHVNPVACLAKIYETSHSQIYNNGGIVPGAVDNNMAVVAPTSIFGGYEDEETMLELMSEQEKEAYQKTSSSSKSRRNTSLCPLLVVSIPEMPLGALVEIEVVAASSMASSSLPIDDYSMTIDDAASSAFSSPTTNSSFDGWDTGHDFAIDHQQAAAPPACRVDAWVRSLGRGCAAYCLVTAAAASASNGGRETRENVDAAVVIRNMVTALSRSLEAGPSCLGLASILHIRFYYVVHIGGDEKSHTARDLSAEIRSTLKQVTTITTSGGELVTPAISVIPVYGMSMLNMSSSSLGNEIRGGIFMAMQATLIEPAALETELWVRHGRG